jgi:hypothetical protein
MGAAYGDLAHFEGEPRKPTLIQVGRFGTIPASEVASYPSTHKNGSVAVEAHDPGSFVKYVLAPSVFGAAWFNDGSDPGADDGGISFFFYRLSLIHPAQKRMRFAFSVDCVDLDGELRMGTLGFAMVRALSTRA